MKNITFHLIFISFLVINISRCLHKNHENNIKFNEKVKNNKMEFNKEFIIKTGETNKALQGATFGIHD